MLHTYFNIMVVFSRNYNSMTKLIFSIILAIIIIFSSDANAISLSSPTPVNGSYITGGATYNFTIMTSIVVVNYSNPSNVVVKLHFGSQEVWPDNRSIYNMTCNEVDESSLLCYKEIEIVAAESGTKEYYFFEAFEDGNYTYLGNISSPLFVTIDRLPPKITALNFENNSYVSSNKLIEVSIEDLHSGVDNSSVIAFIEKNGSISIQNITQINGTKNWKIRINTTEFENNESVKIYVNASDILGNKNTSLLGVAFIDNEAPELILISPKEEEEIRGIYLVNASLRERYSGIEKVTIKVGSLESIASCEKINESTYSCFYNLNTTLLKDGNYSLEAYVFDKANNSAFLSFPISINNKKPSIYLEAPNYANGIVQINSSILGRSDIVTDVFIRIANLEERMSCTQDFSSCSYLLNTTRLSDGIYNIFVYAKNLYNYSVNASKDMRIDNTPPSILLTQDFSQIYVKGTFSFVIIVTDESPLDENEIKLRIDSKDIKLNCTSTLQGRRMQCGGTIDSKIFPDGKNKITFLAKDLANNFAYRNVEIIVDNKGPEFINLIINPTYSKNPTSIYFEALVRDSVSDVSWVRLIIRAENETLTINLRNSSIWSNSALFSSFGSYYVDLQASDINDNVEYYANVGYFFIGTLECGNNICEKYENYCLCKEDCPKPSCNIDEEVSCSGGSPRCVKKNYCGNGVCEANEDCENCKEDCKECETSLITTTIKVGENNGKETIKEKIERDKSGISEQVSIIIEQIANTLKENSYLLVILVLIFVVLLIFVIKIKSRKKHIIIVKLDEEIK